MAEFNIDKDIYVGAGATESSGSDCYAYVIVDWKRNKNGEVVEVTAVEPDLEGAGFGLYAHAKPFCKSWLDRPKHVFKRTRKDHDMFTRNGCWQGSRFGLHVYDHATQYLDPSF